MKKRIVNLKIINNEEVNEYKNLEGYIKDNILFFEDKDNKYKYDFNDNIFEKENNESLLSFKYVEGKEVLSKYYIKELELYIDAKVLTKSLIIDNNNVKIIYGLWLNDEYVGNFKYELQVKED